MPALEYASQHLCSSQRLRHNSYIDAIARSRKNMCTVQVQHNNIHESRTATQTSRHLWQVPLNEKTAGYVLNPVVSSCSVTFRPSDMSSCLARFRELRWINASCAHCAFCYRKCQAASGFNAYEHCHLTGPLTISKNWKIVCCIFAIASRAWFSLPSLAAPSLCATRLDLEENVEHWMDFVCDLVQSVSICSCLSIKQESLWL